jgi:hypothetical protein
LISLHHRSASWRITFIGIATIKLQSAGASSKSFNNFKLFVIAKKSARLFVRRDVLKQSDLLVTTFFKFKKQPSLQGVPRLQQRNKIYHQLTGVAHFIVQTS